MAEIPKIESENDRRKARMKGSSRHDEVGVLIKSMNLLAYLAEAPFRLRSYPNEPELVRPRFTGFLILWTPEDLSYEIQQIANTFLARLSLALEGQLGIQ
jgi:hypothetical protein